MSQDPRPLDRPYNLGSLGRAGDNIVVTAGGVELAQLARWAGVRAIGSFAATIGLQRLSSSRFSYDAELRVDVVQDCVVTLEPVRSVLNRKIHRELYLAEISNPPAAGEVVVEPVSDEDDVREEITNLRYQLAGPLLEELVLAIDPYPRASGVAFAPPHEPEGEPDSPFAVLKNLKK